MASELNLQTQIMKDARNQIEGTFAMKMANHFLSGVPDIVIKAPGHGVVFVEVKKGTINKSGEVSINTTPLQRQTMHNMMAAGLHSEVWVVIEDGQTLMMLRVHPEVTRASCDPAMLPRRIRGRGWPIEDFLNNPVRA
jgi:hypothetical protein